MTSDGCDVPTCAFEETLILIQRFKRHICCKFQIVPKWVPRKSLSKHFLPRVKWPIMCFREPAFLKLSLVPDLCGGMP